MEFLASALHNLLSPMILFFALGLLAGALRSELSIPKGLVTGASLYLLMAVGFRGGAELAQEGLTDRFLVTALAGLVLGMLVLPGLAFGVLVRLGGMDPVNAAAIASHYGSISVVTFVTATNFLARRGIAPEGFMTAVMALMEAPGVIGGILLARRHAASGAHRAGPALWPALRETLLGASPVVLLGSMLVGALVGEDGRAMMDPFILDLFPGILSVFLLAMGLTAGQQLSAFASGGGFLGLFAVAMPLVGGALGALAGSLIGLSVGGTTLLAVLAASASYIAAPAAVRLALPEANAGLPVTLSLGVTFPFNVILGIPLYYSMAVWLHR